MKKSEKNPKGILQESNADEYVSKSLHDIHTSYTSDGESCFVGSDEYGKEFHLCMPTIELLNWADIKYWKEKAIKHIEEMEC